MNRYLVVLAVAAAGLLSARTSAQDLLQPVTLESPVVYVQFSGGGVISSSDVAKYLPRSGHFLPRGELYCQATAIGGSTPQPPIGRSPDRPAAFYADTLELPVAIVQEAHYQRWISEAARRRFSVAVVLRHGPANDPSVLRTTYATFTVGEAMDRGQRIDGSLLQEARYSVPSGARVDVLRLRIPMRFVDSMIHRIDVHVAYPDLADTQQAAIAKYDPGVYAYSAPLAGGFRALKDPRRWSLASTPRIVPIALLYRPPGDTSYARMEQRGETGVRLRASETSVEARTSQSVYGLGPFVNRGPKILSRKEAGLGEHQAQRLSQSFVFTTRPEPGQPGMDDVLVALYNPTIRHLVQGDDSGFLFSPESSESGRIVTMRMRDLVYATTPEAAALSYSERRRLLALDPLSWNRHADLDPNRFVKLGRPAGGISPLELEIQAEEINEAIRNQARLDGRSTSSSAYEGTIPFPVAAGVTLPIQVTAGTNETSETTLEYRYDRSELVSTGRSCSYRVSDTDPNRSLYVDFHYDTLFRTVVIRELVPRPRTLHVGSRGEAILHAFGSEGNSVSGSPVVYGPYSQFVPKAYDRVADGSARLVWAPRYDSSPTISVWVLDRLDRFNGSYRYYPRPAIGWELEGYEVLADGAERFLFHVPASYRSRAAIWRVDAAVRQGLAAGGSAAGIPTRTYEYYESGYRAIGLAEDADGSVRILWSHPSADRAILVSYSSAGWITRVQEYRAWLAGSVATAYEETGDGSARILWRHPNYSYVDVLRSGLATGTRHIVQAWPGTGSVIEDYGLLATID